MDLENSEQQCYIAEDMFFMEKWMEFGRIYSRLYAEEQKPAKWRDLVCLRALFLLSAGDLEEFVLLLHSHGEAVGRESAMMLMDLYRIIKTGNIYALDAFAEKHPEIATAWCTVSAKIRKETVKKFMENAERSIVSISKEKIRSAIGFEPGCWTADGSDFVFEERKKGDTIDENKTRICAFVNSIMGMRNREM